MCISPLKTHEDTCAAPNEWVLNLYVRLAHSSGECVPGATVRDLQALVTLRPT